VEVSGRRFDVTVIGEAPTPNGAGPAAARIEAMKMENEITAPSAGTVEELGVSEGGSVATGDTIAVIK
jgi:biotin carboxyl carrier protein